MTLTYEDLKALTEEVRGKIIGKKLTRFELTKLRTYQLYFENIPVLLSLHPSEVGFYLLSKPQATTLDPFSHFFQKKLRDLICEGIFLLNEDRLIEFRFENEIRLIAALFPKKPNLYLVNRDGTIEASLFPVKDAQFNPPQKPSRQVIDTPSDLTSAVLEFKIAQQEAIERLQTALTKGKQTLRTLEREKEACAKWKTLHRQGILLQSNLYLVQPGSSSTEVTDWDTGEKITIPLDPKKSPHANLKELLKRAKRQQSGLETTAQSIEKQKAKISHLEKQLELLNHAKVVEDLPKPPEKKVKTPPQKGLPYDEFISEAGLPIWVGKGAAKNDLLTFRYAKGSDWWLHVQGYPGSHVVIRTPKNGSPDEESLQDALTLAIAHSKAKGEKYVEVLVTQRKFVSKLGKTGQVQVSQHKIIHSHFDPNRYNRLRKNSNYNQKEF